MRSQPRLRPTNPSNYGADELLADRVEAVLRKHPDVTRSAQSIGRELSMKRLGAVERALRVLEARGTAERAGLGWRLAQAASAPSLVESLLLDVPVGDAFSEGVIAKSLTIMQPDVVPTILDELARQGVVELVESERPRGYRMFRRTGGA